MSIVYLRWRARLSVRRALLNTALRQAAYWRAEKAKAPRGTKRYSHAGFMLAQREAKVKTRRSQVAYAERVVARHRPGATEPAHATRLSPNRSSRRGVKPAIIVLHTMEGGYAGSISWLCNTRSSASAHVCVSKGGHSTRLVPDAEKAWTQASFNPQALSIEQEGYASQPDFPEAQLRATAQWIAYWSRKYDIPITRSAVHGVCAHSDLGAAGGGHHDPGANYPWNHVLELARAYAR